MFIEHQVETLPWPAKSPDLNPIENVWGLLARAVYPNGKQYNDQNELKSAIILEWTNISQEYLQRLIDSMN
jgi:transposase